MTPSAKLIFATNEIPQLRDRSEGIWRRLIVVPFLESFDETCDRSRAERLMKELPGILNWALGERGGFATKVDSPMCLSAACVSEHRLLSDPIRKFMLEETICDPDQQVYRSLLTVQKILRSQHAEASQQCDFWETNPVACARN